MADNTEQPNWNICGIEVSLSFKRPDGHHGGISHSGDSFAEQLVAYYAPNERKVTYVHHATMNGEPRVFRVTTTVEEIKEEV